VSNGIWLLIILILTVCCGFTSFKSYNEWNSQPVITTVSSTGYPISKVQFPSGVNVFRLFHCHSCLRQIGLKGSLWKAFSIIYFVAGWPELPLGRNMVEIHIDLIALGRHLSY